MKNNVTRLLDQRKIPYTAFQLPPEKLGALETARLLNVPPEIVFKTIVILRSKPGKPILAVVPGNREANLKMIASALGEKKVTLASHREAECITGLQTGGISPLALLNRGFSVLIDESAQKMEAIHISGGQRGLNLLLPVIALQELTKGQFGAISSDH